MKIFILICAVIGVASSEISERDCAESAIKQIEFNSTDDPEFCKKLLADLTEEFVQDTKARLKPADDKICILALFEYFDLNKSYLEEYFQHVVKGKPDHEKFVQDHGEVKDLILDGIRKICAHEDSYKIERGPPLKLLQKLKETKVQE